MEQKVLELREKLKDPDEDEIYSALIKIGKGFYKELRSDVEKFLNNNNIELRSAAINVLGFYWKLPEYREIARSIFENDADDWVRSNALMTWIGFYAETNDRKVINKLYEILKNEKEGHAVRAQTYTGILLVSGLPKSEWPKVFVENIKEDVDWDLLKRIIEQ
jgi:hypothetical protein